MTSFDWKPLLHQNANIFSTVPEQKIGKLLADGVLKERAYPKDKDIVRQGEEGDSLFVIGSGSAEALLAVAGEETIRLTTMRKGDVLGEMAFFGRRERAATVRAKEDCTVLEIGGAEFQKLVDEYPDIGSRLLLLMGKRLRDINEKILALHLKTVDEKLKLFNSRLDNEQRSVEARLTSAQAVFDQINTRTNEVISSAERSRDRLTKSAALVFTLVGILGGLAGLFGWNSAKETKSKLSEVEFSRKEIEDKRKEIEGFAKETKESAAEVRAIKKDAEDSLSNLKTDVERTKKDAGSLLDSLRGLKDDLKNSKIEISQALFFGALARGAADDAKEDYLQIKNAGGLDNRLGLLLGEMEDRLVVKAQPPQSAQERKNVRTFGCIFQWAVADAGNRAHDKLHAYYLLLVYGYLTGETVFEDCGIATRENALAALKDYRKSTPKETQPWPTGEDLAKRLSLEAGQRGEDARKLSHLAFDSVGPH